MDRARAAIRPEEAPRVRRFATGSVPGSKEGNFL